MGENAERFLRDRQDLLKEIHNNHINLSVKSIEQFNKWLFECAAFASGAIIVAGSLINRAGANVIALQLYLSMLCSAVTIIVSMWHLKNRAERDLNELPKTYDWFNEMLQIPRDKEHDEQIKAKFKATEEEFYKEPKGKTYIADVVIWLLITSFSLLISSICTLPVYKFLSK